MDKIVYVKKIPLGMDCDFSLYHLQIEHEKKVYIKDMYLKYEQHVIARCYCEVVEFFTILDLFVKKGLSPGDENIFFEYKQKKEQNHIIRSLQYKNNQELYVSTVTAKTMHQLYLDSKQGLFIRNALINETITSFYAQQSIENDLDSIYGKIQLTESYGFRDENGYISEASIEYNKDESLSENFFELLNTLRGSQKR